MSVKNEIEDYLFYSLNGFVRAKWNYIIDEEDRNIRDIIGKLSESLAREIKNKYE